MFYRSIARRGCAVGASLVPWAVKQDLCDESGEMKPEERELIGEMRSILGRHGDARAFAEICLALGDGDASGELIEYIGAHLARTSPDIPRQVPSHWLEPLAERQPPPACALCTDLLLRHQHLDLPALERIVGSPHMANLTRLELGYCGLDSRCLTALARMTHLGQVTRLGLAGNKLDSETAAILAESEAFPSLRSCDLSQTDLSASKINALSPWLDRLEELYLDSNLITDEVAHALFEARPMASLRQLAIGNTSLRRRGFELLARSDYVATLEALTLSHNKISHRTAETLSNTRWFPSLEQIRLHSCGLADSGVALLIDRSDNLETLILAFNRLEDQGAAAIANSPQSASLTSLDLSHNRIGPEGAEALARSPHLANLESFDLFANPIGERGARALASSPYLADELRAQFDW